MPGNNLRRARSPVAPTRTTTCGNWGPTPGCIFATLRILYAGGPPSRAGDRSGPANGAPRRQEGSAQFDLGLRRRSRTRLRCVAAPMVGVDQRKLHRDAAVLAGRVQRIAMKEHRVARREPRRFGGADDLGVVRSIGAEEP